MHERDERIPTGGEYCDERRRREQYGRLIPRARPAIRVAGHRPLQEFVAENEEGLTLDENERAVREVVVERVVAPLQPGAEIQPFAMELHAGCISGFRCQPRNSSRHAIQRLPL